MNMLMHNLKKDIRHFRILLILWFALLLLQTAVSGFGATVGAANIVMTITLKTLATLMPLLQCVLIVAMIPLLIHDEPLVGTTAFWFTRPIARKTLLSSKALFAGAFLVLPPVAVQMILLAGTGISAGHLLLAVFETLLQSLSFLLVVAGLAVLTPNFARFALVGVICFVVSMLIAFCVSMVRLFLDPEGMAAQMEQRHTLELSRSIVSSLLMIATGTVVVWHQYLTRRSVRSFVMFVMGILLCFVAGQKWPWDFLAVPRVAVSSALVDTNRVVLAMDRVNGASCSESSSLLGNAKKRRHVSSGLMISGLPESVFTKFNVEKAILTLPDGKAGPAVGPSSALSYDGPRGWHEVALMDALGNMTVVNSQNQGIINRFNTTHLLTLSEDDFLACESKEMNLSLTVDVETFRYQVVASIPLRKKAYAEQGTRQTLITDIVRATQGCTVMLRERWVNLPYAKETRLRSMRERFTNKSGWLYVLCNRKRQQAVLPEDAHESVNFTFDQNAHLRMENQQLRFANDRNYRLDFQLDDNWLADAELVCIECVSEGHFIKRLDEKAFVMQDNRNKNMRRQQDKGVDPEALKKIVLPTKPTQDQVREYVKAIVETANYQQQISSADPQVEMLLRVGAENLDVLIAASNDYYVKEAAKRLLGAQHKELVLKSLPRHPWLAYVVLTQDWAQDAREPMIQSLRTGGGDNSDVVRAVASLRDPTTYPDLLSALSASALSYGPSAAATYDAIQDLPGIDLTNTVAKTWRIVRYHPDFRRIPFLPAALACGQRSALDVAAKWMEERGNDVANAEQIRAAIWKHVEADTNQSLQVWVNANTDRIRFDSATRRFTLK